MSTPKAAQPTAGAMRAAVKIAANHPGSTDKNYVHFCAELAEIIDRETHAGELLEALEDMVRLSQEGPDAFEEPLEIIARAREAIAKVRQS